MRELTLNDLLNIVYHGALKEVEAREHDGSLRADGHHVAQAITTNVELGLRNHKRFADLFPQEHLVSLSWIQRMRQKIRGY